MDGVMTLLKEKRGTYIEMEHISNMRVIIKYYMPMAEMVIDFYNKLNSKIIYLMFFVSFKLLKLCSQY